MERILFVDDQAGVIENIERLRTLMQNQWQVDLVHNDTEAIDALSGQEYDVVVSEGESAQIDSETILSKVMEQHPSTIRFMLSDQFNETVMKCCGKAHQFIAKSSDADTFIKTITRACKLRDLLSNQRLKKLLNSVQKLPSIPDMYAELRAELVKDDCSVRRIGEIISRDVAMSTKILRIVNSAAFGIRQQVTSIEQAVAYLGSSLISILVLSQKLFDTPNPNVDRKLLEILQRHSFETASRAKAIAHFEGMSKDDQEESFACGLLHDVGQLILLTHWTAPYSAVIKKACIERRPLYQVEREMLGGSHDEVGAYLLGMWGLPERIIETIAYHHEPERLQINEFGTITTVHVADILSCENQNDHYFHSGAYLSLTYLDELGVADHIDAWRSLSVEPIALAS